MHPPHIGGGLGGGGCFFASFFAPKKVRIWQGSALQKGGMGDIPQQGKALLDATFTQGYNNSYTFRAPPVNVAIKRAESDAHIDYPERE